MTYQAILFDLDGTLLDTVDDLGDSMNILLERAGWPQHDMETYKFFIGDGVENLVRRALPEAQRDGATVASYVEAFRAEYDQRWANKTELYPGVPELLDALTGRKIKMAILSNKMDDFTQRVVAKLLSQWRFEVILGAQPDAPKKPDPTTALQVAKRLGLSPGDFLYLGDTKVDMMTATAAGMYAVGALWGFRPAEELTSSGAKTLIEKPPDLLGLL